MKNFSSGFEAIGNDLRRYRNGFPVAEQQRYLGYRVKVVLGLEPRFQTPSQYPVVTDLRRQEISPDPMIHSSVRSSQGMSFQ